MSQESPSVESVGQSELLDLSEFIPRIKGAPHHAMRLGMMITRYEMGQHVVRCLSSDSEFERGYADLLRSQIEKQKEMIDEYTEWINMEFPKQS